MNPKLRQALVPAVVIVLALLLLQKFRGAGGGGGGGDGGVAPTPPVFAQGLTLAQAEGLSRTSNKPVLVYATADWCGPCQHFKRTTLLDPGVVAFIQTNTVPVYLNVDEHQGDAARFNISSIPATVLLRGGTMAAKFSAGAVEPDEYLAWLKTEAQPK